MKKFSLLMLLVVMSFQIMACSVDVNIGGEDKQTQTDDNDRNEDADRVEDEHIGSDSETKPNNDNEDDFRDTEDSEVESETSSNKPDNNTDQSSDNSELQDGEWVNIDKMQFKLDGHVYTLGETTLQDMIDDGIKFEVEDLENAGNNLKSDATSDHYRVYLDDYYSFIVYVGNFTESGKTESELPIIEAYLPVDLEKDNSRIEFAFPLDMTIEDLKANAGEPTEYDTYGEDTDYISESLSYERESSEYYGYAGYEFEFMNNELNYVTMMYLP